MTDIDSLMPEIESTETPPDLPEAQLNVEAPADKEPVARDESGKFAAKDKKEEPAKEPAKVEKPEHTVPVRTLVDERKAWQAEKKALEERLAKLENPAKPAPVEPDYAADPKGYTDHKVKAALDQLEGTKKQVEQVQQTAQMSQQQAEQLQFTRHLEAAEAAFVRETPDYYEALSHVRQVRANQLKLLAPDMPDDQIARAISQEEIGLAMQLARAGRNPIATVYEIAKGYGYQKKAPAVELPKVEGQKRLPPDQTLGTGAQTDSEPKDEQQADPFEEAFGQMFGRRKAS